MALADLLTVKSLALKASKSLLEPCIEQMFFFFLLKEKKRKEKT